jgi:hypothetical protein
VTNFHLREEGYSLLRGVFQQNLETAGGLKRFSISVKMLYPKPGGADRPIHHLHGD